MKILFFVFVLFFPLIINAQNIKTDVLVIGSGNAAFAAGVQASESNVKTTILTQSIGFKLSDLTTQNQNGITNVFFKHIRKTINLPDSLPLPSITFQNANAVIKNWSDSSKKFQVINNISFTQAKRSGSGWQLKLSDGRYIKSKVLILAEPSENLLKVLKIDSTETAKTNFFNYKDNFYRTTIAGINGNEAKFLSLYNLLIPNQENLIYIDSDLLEIGQAAGATAAYASFFETKTSLSDLKKIQVELLTYKLSLIPFEDVKIADSSWLAIQKIGITGIIKGEFKNGKLYYNSDELVNYNEIKQPLKDYFYKAQIWFDDHENVPINLENTISLVSYVGNKSPEATRLDLEKNWNKVYKFTSKFDLKKLLTRGEFAVILNTYLNAFDTINIDKTGRIIR